MTGPKPFNRAAAKAAGYSDAEIDAYLGKQAPQAPASTGTFDRAGAKAAGYSDAEIDAHLAANAPKPTLRQEISGGSAEFLQGVGLGVPGLLSKKLKGAAEGFGAQHHILGPVLKGAGAITGGFALPASWGIRAGARALLGGGAAAVDAAASGDGTPKERVERAVVPAAVGAAASAALPPVAGLAGKFVGRILKPLFPTKTVAKAVGPLLPADAAAKMARLEQLAPGTSTVASLSPEIPASTRVLGANPKVAFHAQEGAEDRLLKLKTALQGMKSQYDAVLTNQGQPIHAPLAVRGGPNITPTLVKNGHLPTGSTSLENVQGLRNAVRAKRDALFLTAQRGKGGGPLVHELNQQYDALTKWLEYHAPGITKIDQDYRVLSDARRAEETVLKNIKQSRKAYASSRAAGIEPGSPGASLPSKSGILHSIFSPDRKNLAAATEKLLLQPGQIPKELLNARRTALHGPTGRPGLLGSIGLGVGAGDLSDQLSGLLGQ